MQTNKRKDWGYKSLLIISHPLSLPPHIKNGKFFTKRNAKNRSFLQLNFGSNSSPLTFALRSKKTGKDDQKEIVIPSKARDKRSLKVGKQ